MTQVRPYIRKVNYYETDQMGIVHHSNYIRYMEEARLDFMEQIKLYYNAMEQEGIVIPVLSVQCEYKKPFRYGDTMDIYVTPVLFNGVKMRIEYRMCLHDTEEVYTVASSEHCFLNNELKPIRMKRDFVDTYQKLLECVTTSES